MLPFGLYNDSTTFQRAVLAIFADLEFVEIYMDNFSVFGDSFQEALENLEKVLLQCEEAHLTLSDKKCKLMCKVGVVLDHLISSKGIQVDPAKIEIILHLLAPKTQREVRGFLGHASYYRKFIENFSNIVAPLFRLLAKDGKFSWTTACQQSFETLKEKLVQAPVMRGFEVFVHTDHSAIKYLMNKPLTSCRVTRWLLLLQEFNIAIVDKPGKSNVVEDFLSRLDNLGETTPVNDDFPNEHLFAMSTDSPWFADITNYLVTRKTPPHLSTREKQNIIQKSVAYSWIQGDLFYTGPDLIIRRCVREKEVLDILKSAHDEPCGGHFADQQTAYKVLRAGYFWPSLFKDAKQFVKHCDSCQ
eukprot:PITA_31150